MLIATDYLILRDIVANGRVSHALERKPVRVATIIDEERLVESGFEMAHNQTVFLEDQFHDWHWENGGFRFFSRVAEKADVLIVYESKEVYRFCTRCGTRHQPLSETILCESCINTGE
jgi:NADH pyrophosphatase NudC (nudix superfamily)